MIRDRSKKLHAFHAQQFLEQVNERPASTNGYHAKLTDEEVIELCRRARNVPKFETVYDQGNTGGDDGDHSRADQSLINVMAFYTQDPE